MQSLLAPFFPDGNHNYWKSTLQREFSDESIRRIVEHANCISSRLSAIVVEYYAGAAGRIPKDATAFPHRDLPWDVLFLAQWTEPQEAGTHRDWARNGEECLRPFSDAHLLSALDIESKEIVDTAFGANLPRLIAVKKKYDPSNFFRVNYNIDPNMAYANAV
jgi:Berberine and berberine like